MSNGLTLLILQSFDLLKKTILGYRVKRVNLINSFSNQRCDILTIGENFANGVGVSFSLNSASILKL